MYFQGVTKNWRGGEGGQFVPTDGDKFNDFGVEEIFYVPRSIVSPCRLKGVYFHGVTRDWRGGEGGQFVPTEANSTILEEEISSTLPSFRWMEIIPTARVRRLMNTPFLFTSLPWCGGGVNSDALPSVAPPGAPLQICWEEVSF